MEEGARLSETESACAFPSLAQRRDAQLASRVPQRGERQPRQAPLGSTSARARRGPSLTPREKTKQMAIERAPLLLTDEHAPAALVEGKGRHDAVRIGMSEGVQEADGAACASARAAGRGAHAEREK